MDKEGNEFEVENLMKIIREYSDKKATEILEEITSAVKKHSTDYIQSDDITLIVVKVL